MHNELNRLVQTLRDELKQYCEMLVRLEQQKQVVQIQSRNGFRSLTREIKAQCQAVHRAQYLRAQASRNVALSLHLKTINPMEEMIPLLPKDYQPLIGELYRANREQMEQVVFALVHKISSAKN